MFHSLVTEVDGYMTKNFLKNNSKFFAFCIFLPILEEPQKTCAIYYSLHSSVQLTKHQREDISTKYNNWLQYLKIPSVEISALLYERLIKRMCYLLNMLRVMHIKFVFLL